MSVIVISRPNIKAFLLLSSVSWLDKLELRQQLVLMIFSVKASSVWFEKDALPL